jgi:hypothetical protein
VGCLGITYSSGRFAAFFRRSVSGASRDKCRMACSCRRYWDHVHIFSEVVVGYHGCIYLRRECALKNNLNLLKTF